MWGEIEMNQTEENVHFFLVCLSLSVWLFGNNSHAMGIVGVWNEFAFATQRTADQDADHEKMRVLWDFVHPSMWHVVVYNEMLSHASQVKHIKTKNEGQFSGVSNGNFSILAISSRSDPNAK